MVEKKEIDNIIFSSGSDLLDIVVGGGLYSGFLAGRIINLVGDKSTGKTFLACEMIANAYYKYGKKFKWVYDDAESGFTFDTKFLYGFDIIPNDEKKVARSNTVQDLYCNYRNFLESLKGDECGIYVIDCLDGLSSDEILDLSEQRFKNWKKDKKFDKGSYKMEAAKFLSQEFFRGLAGLSDEKNCMLVIISQVRDNIDSFSFKKFKRSGGKALDHYCHTILWLVCLKHIEKKNRAIGITIKAKLDKSKTPRPYRDCVLTILFDYGVDNVGSNIDFLYELLTPGGQLTASESKQKLFWDDSEISYNREELIRYIENNKLQKELRKRVADKWEKIEASIKSERTEKYH